MLSKLGTSTADVGRFQHIGPRGPGRCGCSRIATTTVDGIAWNVYPVSFEIGWRIMHLGNEIPGGAVVSSAASAGKGLRRPRRCGLLEP